ncbi:MAG: ABC transporter permease [Myxococcales bacterium]|nr:ABC transporter permease [Myxococcales bacterium]
MRAFLIRTGALAAKETLHVLRDQQVIYLALGMPLTMVLLFGYAVSFDVTEIPIAIVDHDRSPASRRVARAFDASDAFRIVARPERAADADVLLRRGQIRAALVVPRGYARTLARGGASGETIDLQLLMDGADGTTARVALAYANAAVSAHVAQLAAGSAGTFSPPIATRLRTLFNPRMESALFVVPGVAAVVLGVLCVLLSSITVAREWERGSMEQLFATPVERLSIVLGKLLPYLVLGFVQLLLVLCLGAWLFEVPANGSLLLLFGVSLLFIICALAQGLLISMVARNQQVATQVGAISSVMPALLLSGFIFPIDNMPAPLQWISHVVPARYMITLLRGILLQGRGVAELWPQVVGVAVLAVVLVALATARSKRRLD